MSGKTKKAVGILTVTLIAGAVAMLAMHYAHRYKGPSHFPKSAWVSAGFGDPVSALETACWAGMHGDGKTMLASLTPELQLPLKKAWEKNAKAQGISLEDFFASHAAPIFGGVLGFRVLNEHAVNDQEAVVQVYIQGWWHKATIKMRKIGEEWKVAGFLWQ